MPNDVLKASGNTGAVDSVWWKNARAVTAVAALIASTGPTTVAARGCIQKDLELELAARKQTRELHDRYLEVVARDDKTALIALSFIRETASESTVRVWAAAEYAKLAERQRTREQVGGDVVVTIKRLARAVRALEQATSHGGPNHGATSPSLASSQEVVLREARNYWDLSDLKLPAVSTESSEPVLSQISTIVRACEAAASSPRLEVATKTAPPDLQAMLASRPCDPTLLDQLAGDLARQLSKSASSVRASGARFEFMSCGAIADHSQNSEWFIAPESIVDYRSAASWTKELKSCGGGWRMPSVPELSTLFDKSKSAGRGFLKDGVRYPAHIDPVFGAIGDGSWVWSSEKDDSSGTGKAYNFYINAPVSLKQIAVLSSDSGSDGLYSTRAFAVRSASRDAGVLH